MTTVVEHPIGAHNTAQTSQPQSSRRNTIEIIDVDTFEESSSSSQRSRPPSRTRPQREAPELIYLISDSEDDEMQTVASRVLSSHNVDRNRSHRSFISPAPQAGSSAPPPPLPPVPRRYAGQTSLPMRHHHQAHPPIIPLAEPIIIGRRERRPPIEPDAGPSNPNRNAWVDRGAAPSHHTPVMGLGGALISSNRTQTAQRLREADVAATHVRRTRRPIRDMINRFAVTERDDDDLYLHAFLMADEAADAYLPTRWRDFLHLTRLPEPREEPHYQQKYTHPTPPEPGFTFDFTAVSSDGDKVSNGRYFPPTSRDEPIILDDDEDTGDASEPTAGSSSTSKKRECSPQAGTLSALLVCAKCHDPLILNAALDPEEAQYKRIWALRCGHLIDEKCLNVLGQPSEAEEVIPDRKGKGKAKAVPPKNTYGDAVPELQSVISNAESTDIRSRLRSRRSAGPPPGRLSPISQSHHMWGGSIPGLRTPFPSPPTKKRKVSHKKPKLEGEYEWLCPVVNCGRVHVSVKIDGIWGPEKEVMHRSSSKMPGAWSEPRGAIAVFA